MPCLVGVDVRLRSGYREQPWPIPGTNDSVMFRGIRNFDATMDLLTDKFGLGSAKNVRAR